jgi:hypothetical protein
LASEGQHEGQRNAREHENEDCPLGMCPQHMVLFCPV